MNPNLRPAALVWATIATVLFVGTLINAEIAIIAFWLNMIWTFPFGLLWKLLTQYLTGWMPSGIAYHAALLIIDIVTLLFWFVALPKTCAILVAKRKAE
jgi:hypothetical protein